MPAVSPCILALGPNPAVQRVLTFEAPVGLGEVNRASSVSTYVGGKGQGVALALQSWAPATGRSHWCAQFVGGDSGAWVEEKLCEAGLRRLSIAVPSPTRTCTTLLGADGAQTELVEPSGAVRPADVDAMVGDLVGTALPECGALAMCGTTPPGGAALYGSLCDALGQSPHLERLLVVLDGHREARERPGHTATRARAPALHRRAPSDR